MFKNITILSIYDFDSTIAYTYGPEIGKQIWKNVTGFDYPFKSKKDFDIKKNTNGWWGKLESMDPDVFDIKLNTKVVKSLLYDIKNDSVYTVLLTGRRKDKKVNFEPYIKQILEKNNIPNLDEYCLNNKNDTLNFKLSELDRLKALFENLKHINIWEDRLEHIPHFKQWCIENMGENFTLNIVQS